MFVERIILAKSYERPIWYEWGGYPYELRRAQIRKESDEWINNCRLKIADSITVTIEALTVGSRVPFL